MQLVVCCEMPSITHVVDLSCHDCWHSVLIAALVCLESLMAVLLVAQVKHSVIVHIVSGSGINCWTRFLFIGFVYMSENTYVCIVRLCEVVLEDDNDV